MATENIQVVSGDSDENNNKRKQVKLQRHRDLTVRRFGIFCF